MSGPVLNDGINALADNPAPAQNLYASEAASSFDPADHTIDGVKAFLAEHPEQRDRVTDAETEGKGRVRLLAWLENDTDDEPAGAGAGDTTSEEN